MANYTNEKLAWAALSNMFPNSYNPLGAIGNMISGAQTTPDVPTRGMMMDRANGTDTASRQKAVETAKPLTNLTVPNTDPDQAWYNIPGHIGNMFSGPSQPPPAATTRGMILDRERGTDTASRRAAQSAAGTNVGGGAPIGVGEAAGTNFGGGTPNGGVSNLPPKLPAMGSKLPAIGGKIPFNGAKQAMDKQALGPVSQLVGGVSKRLAMAERLLPMAERLPRDTYASGPVSSLIRERGQGLLAKIKQMFTAPISSNPGTPSITSFNPKVSPKDMAGLNTHGPNPGHYRNVITGEQTPFGPFDPYGLGLKNPTIAEQIKNLITGNSKTAMSNLPPKLPAMGGKIPFNGAKQAMDKQAIAFHANRLHILNTELARYTPATLLKQAAEYPTTRNKQACAYYLGLKKQAAIEKKAIMSLIGQGLKAGWGLLKAPFGATARGHMADAGKAALRGVEIATKKAPIASLAGFGGLTLGAEHVGLPFLGDVAEATKARYNDTEKGIGNFFHRLSRGYNATTADPTSDFASSGINKAKKVIESATPKAINSAVTNSGIIPSKPSRYLRVEEGSIPAEYRSRSLPESNPQWRSGTRGRYYDY